MEQHDAARVDVHGNVARRVRGNKETHDMRYAAGLPVMVGAVMLLHPAAQANEQAEREAMLAEVAQLRDQVATIRATKDGHWLTQSRADEIRSLVNDVLADADTRASLMANGVGAGYDPVHGFYIQSSDEQFRVNVRGVVRARYIANFQDDDAGGIDSTRWGFDNPQTRLLVNGQVNERFSFRVENKFGFSDGETWQYDSFIRWDGGGDYSLRVGQFDQPFLKESLVDSVNQVAITPSLYKKNFGYGRSQGIELEWNDGSGMRARVAYNDGESRDNEPALEMDTEFAITGRLDYEVGRGENTNGNGNGNGNGNWDEPMEGRYLDNRGFDDDPGFRAANINLGVGGFFMKAESGTATDADEVFGFTVDGKVASGPWSAFASFAYRAVDFENPASDDQDQYGVNVEGAYFLTENTQLYGRYEYIDMDTTDDKVNVLTGGVNWWPGSNANARVSGDVSYAFDPIPMMLASDYRGYRADSSDADSQVVVRLQMQLLF
jgi:hypothetical protein